MIKENYSRIQKKCNEEQLVKIMVASANKQTLSYDRDESLRKDDETLVKLMVESANNHLNIKDVK